MFNKSKPQLTQASQPKGTKSQLKLTSGNSTTKHMSTISERVETILEHFGIPQVKLAEACGVTKQAVTKWRNNSMPSAEAAIRLRESYGVNDVWFITGKGSMLVEIQTDEFTKSILDLSPHLSDEAKRSILSVAREMATNNSEQ